jgi:hypothetical protein
MKYLLMLSMSALLACGETPSANNPDGGTSPDATVNEPQCSTNPATHLELINACTNAAHEDKTPVLPLLRADGTLPPLP